ELVGVRGRVTSVELDPGLAAQARAALAAWPQATVVAGDGTQHECGAVDVIVASAGATHPQPRWLDALRPGGRLLFPLTADRKWGGMLLVTRRATGSFAAAAVCPAGFIPFIGAREADANRRLEAALARGIGGAFAVKSLRRDGHEAEASCWLHGAGYCLSRCE